MTGADQLSGDSVTGGLVVAVTRPLDRSVFAAQILKVDPEKGQALSTPTTFETTASIVGYTLPAGTYYMPAYGVGEDTFFLDDTAFTFTVEAGKVSMLGRLYHQDNVQITQCSLDRPRFESEGYKPTRDEFECDWQMFLAIQNGEKSADFNVTHKVPVGPGLMPGTAGNWASTSRAEAQAFLAKQFPNIIAPVVISKISYQNRLLNNILPVVKEDESASVFEPLLGSEGP